MTITATASKDRWSPCVTREGRIALLRKARKFHRCGVCQELIDKGNQYYSITIGGGGLCSLKFPERVHCDCLEAFFEKVRKSREL